MTYLLSLLLRLLQLVYNSTCIYYSYYGQVTYPPPQPSARARSLPVPRGRTATAGGGWKLSWSSTESTQPTVPSPPHASTRRLATLRNISNLVREKHHLNLSLSLSLPPKKKFKKNHKKHSSHTFLFCFDGCTHTHTPDSDKVQATTQNPKGNLTLL